MAANSAGFEDERAGRLRRAPGHLLLLVLPLLCGCGIYVTGDALNPPFGISVSGLTLQFTGYNTETTFAGYTIWFKETADEGYRVAGYKGKLAKPTIPWLPGGPQVVFTVQVVDLFHPEEGKSFSDLNDEDGSTFFFAVSATDTEGRDGELVEFGEWPS